MGQCSAWSYVTVEAVTVSARPRAEAIDNKWE